MAFSKLTSKDISSLDPRNVFKEMLKVSSGTQLGRTLKYNIFYQIIAFKGVRDGIGTSTIVANTAIALAKLGLTVCVVDTSILYPCQDIFLKTNYQRDNSEDWFNMGFTHNSVLNISSIDKKISVLSFKDRTIIDLLSTTDNSDLVELAFSQISTKFDIILVDICSEPSCISTTSMQLSHKMIQVWNDSMVSLRSVENFITNNVICSCSMDKMRYVVTSKCLDGLSTDWDAFFKKYHYKHLGSTTLSLEVARLIETGQVLYGAGSVDDGVQDFNDCITDIVCHILGITADGVQDIDYNSGTAFEEVVSGQEYDAADYPETQIMSNNDTDYMQDYQDNVVDIPDDISDRHSTSGRRGFFGLGGRR